MNELLNILKLLNIEETNPDKIVEHILIYLRKSRKDSEYIKDESIEKTLQRHEERLQRWAFQIFGVKIPEKNIYREVVSGDTIDNRPAFQNVLLKVETPDIKGVLIVEVERLGRGDGEDQARITKTFKYTNTKIITPTKIFDLDNEMDLQFFEDNLYQSRKYLQYTKKILRNGVISSVLAKKWPYSVSPYGYRRKKLENEKGFTLVEDEIEGPIKREIFELFVYGIHFDYILNDNDTACSIANKFGLCVKTIKELVDNNKDNTIHIDIEDSRPQTIANYLNYLGIKPRNSEKWTSNMVRNILLSSNGIITYGRKSTQLNMVNGELRESRPIKKSGEYIEVKGDFAPIVDEKIYQLAQEKIKKVSTGPVNGKNEFKNPLQNIVFCGCCEKSLTRRPPTGTNKPKLVNKRKYKFTDEELQELANVIHNHYIETNLSINNIARALKITRNKTSLLLTKNLKYFRVCPREKWIQLKAILKIEDTSYDDKIMTYEEQLVGVQDILICKDKDCPTIGSNLKLVETKLIQALQYKLSVYKKYIDTTTVTQEKMKESNLKDILNNQLLKKKKKLERIYELAEDGIYDKKTFLERYEKIKKEINVIEKQLKILNKENKKSKKEKLQLAIPILENVLKSYNDCLNPEQKNKLLSAIVEKVYYYKDVGGRGHEDEFRLEIKLKERL